MGSAAQPKPSLASERGSITALRQQICHVVLLNNQLRFEMSLPTGVHMKLSAQETVWRGPRSRLQL